MDNFKESLLEIDFSINFSLRIIHHVLFNVFYGNKHLGNLNAVNKRAERLSGYWIMSLFGNQTPLYPELFTEDSNRITFIAYKYNKTKMKDIVNSVSRIVFTEVLKINKKIREWVTTLNYEVKITPETLLYIINKKEEWHRMLPIFKAYYLYCFSEIFSDKEKIREKIKEYNVFHFFELKTKNLAYYIDVLPLNLVKIIQEYVSFLDRDIFLDRLIRYA